MRMMHEMASTRPKEETVEKQRQDLFDEGPSSPASGDRIGLYWAWMRN